MLCYLLKYLIQPHEVLSPKITSQNHSLLPLTVLPVMFRASHGWALWTTGQQTNFLNWCSLHWGINDLGKATELGWVYKRRVKKTGLKLNIQKIKIMASGPITLCQIEGETMETVTDFIFLGSKITVDGDCSHEIKRCLLLGRKAMTNLDNVLKSKDITLQTMVHIVKSMVFPVVMYGCESLTITKAEP